MIDYKNILSLAKEILAIPSPSGYTKEVINFLVEICKKENYVYEVLNNGNLMVTIPGEDDYIVGLSAHVDTLGAMISAINGDGTLKFDPIGSPVLPTYDGEYCTIHTRSGKVYNGTFLSNSPAAHVFSDSSSKQRSKDNMHVRIDELVHNKAEVKALGIENGDYIALDPKTEITESGFIKSRFLDDKLSVAIIFELFKELKENKLTPKHTLKLIITETKFIMDCH